MRRREKGLVVGAAQLAVHIKVKTGGPCQRHMPHEAEIRHLGFDGHIGGIGGKPDSSARGTEVEALHRFTGGLGHRFGHSYKLRFIFVIVKAVNLKRLLPRVEENHVFLINRRLYF